MLAMCNFAAVAGSMLDCELRSGSFTDRACFDPPAMADAAALAHPETDCWPQNMGTYSAPERIDPSGDEPQL